MSQPSRNLRALAWIKTQPDPYQEHIETSFAIDGTHVFRREIDLSEAVPRPKYCRADHADVLGDDNAFAQAGLWEPVAETGEPLGLTYSVRVTFDHVAIVRASDPAAAKAKALRRLNLPERLRADVRAVATLMPEICP